MPYTIFNSYFRKYFNGSIGLPISKSQCKNFWCNYNIIIIFTCIFLILQITIHRLLVLYYLI